MRSFAAFGILDCQQKIRVQHEVWQIAENMQTQALALALFCLQTISTIKIG